MNDLSENFAQPCTVLKDFQAVLYAPESKKLLLIPQENLVNFECRVTPTLRNDAILTFEDSENYQELIDSNTNMWLHVFYVENEGDYIRRDFRVLDTIKGNTQNQVTVKLNLQDALSYIFSKTYKSSKNTSLKSCLENYYNEFFRDPDFLDENLTLPGGLKGFRCYYTIDAIDDLNVEFSIPGNLDFLTAYENELIRQGFVWYQEDNCITLVSVDSLNPSKLKGYNVIYKRYGQDLANVPYFLYFSKFYERPKDSQKPKSDTINYDFAKKKINMVKQNLDISGLSDEFQDSNGYELQYTETDNSKRQLYETYFNFLDNYTGKIVIPGRKKHIKLFQIIRIEAYNPSAKDEKGDIKNSGYFIISGYVNKIMFREKLTTLVKISRF